MPGSSFCNVCRQQKGIVRNKKSFRGFATGFLNTWEDQITVIGDKTAEHTVVFYGQAKDRFLSTQRKLRNIFNNSVKTIVVVRDPFNAILRKCKVALESSPRKMYGILNNKTLDVILGDLHAKIRDYMNWMSSVDQILKDELFDVKLIQLEEMFKDPEPTVREWCQWLNIECFPEYISLIKNTTKSSGNSDKFDYYWPRASIVTMNNFIGIHSHLYSFGGRNFKIVPDYFRETSEFKKSRKSV